MNALSSLQSRLARLGVGQQLGAAFAVVLGLVAVLGAVSVLALQRVESSAEGLAFKWLAGVGHLAAARTNLLEMRDLEVKHSRTSDRSYHSEYEEKIATASKEFARVWAAYRELPDRDGDETKLVSELDKAWAAYQKAAQQVLSLGKEKKQTDAADISDGAASMALDETVGALTSLTKFNFDHADADATRARATYKLALASVGGLLAVALLAGAGMAWLISRGLVGQLGGEPAQAVQVARAVAAGDLTTAIRLRPGDQGSLMACLSAMQDGLAAAVRQVRDGSEHVATSSSQIASGNQDLSGRTEQQASALQQTAATMEQLGTTVRHNADSARQANELAQGAASVATRGGAVVGQVVDTMRGIQESSRKIADIIAVIDGIAFQTNILALNAAVEAARAGEQGRGFAVVAGEVRNLAQRSAEAAKEIKSLISTSVDRVEQGTSLVDQAGQTMQEIVGAIGRVSSIVGEISSASVEQSSGVNQVSQAVTQMDQATQQNAALVEQSAAAAESLKQQAQQLVQAVAVFRLA
jgi:methyl-accepting chemotaxis protein